MSVHSADRYLEYVPSISTTLGVWLLAVALFGIGDTATTMYFLSTSVATEGNPLVAPALEAVGLWILIPWKTAAIGLFYGLYRLVPDDMAIGVPIGLALLGAALTVWNVSGAMIGQNPLPIF
ncbi:hypothetical protein [Natrinema sp. DC36]|uniref:hypothetical protein n=1 Tax=Natrinema sp. DC36 TaxID=2878680 RepID=UPI001CF0BAD2|nr:hypothetical protein [Natrinema sp. DC36]